MGDIVRQGRRTLLGSLRRALRLFRNAKSAPATSDKPAARQATQRARLWFGRARRPLLSLLIAATIPILLFGGWVGYITAERSRAQAREAALRIVNDVAGRVAAEIVIQLQVAETLAASPDLDQPDLQQFYEHAQRVKSTRPLWETVELTGPAGNQIINLLRPLGAPLGATADRESFEVVIGSGRATVGGIGPVGLISGKRLVSLRVPVAREEQLRYVLTVALVPDAVSSILREAGAPKDWIGGIVDARGLIIARTQSEEAELGRPATAITHEAIARAPFGFYTTRTKEGFEAEVVYRDMPETGGWSVHLGIPSEALNRPVGRSLTILASGGIASLLLAGGLASLMARDIAQRRQDEHARAALALRQVEDRVAVAVEAAELGSWRWDIERDAIIGSEQTRALLDLPRLTPMSGEFAWPLQIALHTTHPDDREIVQRALGHCVADHRPIDVEFRVLRPGGQAHWVRLTGRLLHGDSDAPQFVHGVIADIEPRKRAEAERLALLRRLAEAQEDEQRRIARELHDQVGQTVTGLSLGLKGLEHLLEEAGTTDPAREQVRWLQTLTTEIGRDIHRTAADLRPTALDDFGLVRALETLSSDWSERFGVAVDVQAIGIESRLPREIESVVYRVVQEALTNVLKHAAAHMVSILLEHRLQRLKIIIEDDGVGFDLAAIEERRVGPRGRPHLGLSGIRERLSLVGGSLSIESAPGGGTTLFMQIPMTAAEPLP